MTTLPFDIYHHIIPYASLGVINSLARACSIIARQVRECAHALASARTACTGVRNRQSDRLSNGVFHGCTCAGVSTGSFAIDFELGRPTTWFLYSVKMGHTWGHNDVNYTLQYGSRDYFDQDHWIHLTFLGGAHLAVHTSGIVRYTPSCSTVEGSPRATPGQKYGTDRQYATVLSTVNS